MPHHIVICCKDAMQPAYHEMLLIIILPLTFFPNRLLHFILGTFVMSATTPASCFSFRPQGVTLRACQLFCIKSESHTSGARPHRHIPDAHEVHAAEQPLWSCYDTIQNGT
jgi:hypothetical protein